MVPEYDTPLQVHLLGPLLCRRGDVELDLGPAYRRAVLAVLALRAGDVVSREEMINAVWGEHVPTSASGSVYTYISALRQVLEPDRDRWSPARILVSGNGGYCLNLSDDNVDALRFATLRQEMLPRRAAGNTHAELAVAKAALDLWRGEALIGIPGPFADGHRRRLADLRLATIERHSALVIETGRPQEVLRTLRRLVEEHPTRESLHALLMTGLLRAGRPAEAVDVYWKAHETFVEHSGMEPSEDLRLLHDQIISGSSATARTSITATSSPRALPPTGVDTVPLVVEESSGPAPLPFVGRDEQVETLRNRLAAVARGEGGCVWIAGEPGIGKSALLDEALRDAERLGCRVGRGVGDEYAQRMPLTVLLECLDDAGLLPRQDPATEAAGTSAEYGHQDISADVHHRVGAVVRRHCESAALVLVMDDVQWADDASLLAWHSLHPLTREMPLLLIAAGRPTPARREVELLRNAAEAAGDTCLDIPSLSVAEIDLFVRSCAELADTRSLDADASLAGGNPHHLRALIAIAAAGDDVRAVPSTLAPMISDHLAIVGEQTRDLLRAAALLTETCLIAEMAAVTGRSVPDLVEPLEEALAAGLLMESSLGGVRFRHPLIRLVLRDGTPAAIRTTLHGEFAQRLAASGLVEGVAAQLLAGPVPLDEWSCRWLNDNCHLLATRDPDAATALLRHAATQPNLDPRIRQDLTAALARLLLIRGQDPLPEAQWLVQHTTRPALVAEMRWIIATVRHRVGAAAMAGDIVSAALADRTTPAEWRQRFRLLQNRLSARTAGQ